MIVVPPHGAPKQDDRRPALKVLQELVQGYVTCVPRMFALCDEDAGMKNSPLNRTASNWVQFPIFGTVVFLSHEEWNEFTSPHE
jgi:hypothetical protein